jgi:fucose 4-O-acetylase-like acetyltransferase
MEIQNHSRVYYLDYIKALIIVLIVAHHSSLAYTSVETALHQSFSYSSALIIDKSQAYYFDYFANFNDIYFMPLMFLISGFFVYDSLKKKGAMGYVGKRFIRLMVPFIFSLVILMPLAYYPVNLLKNIHLTFFDYLSKDYIMNFYKIPGPIWYLLALFVFDVIVAIFYKFFPKQFENIINTVNQMGKINFALSFVSITIVIYFLSYIFLPSDDPRMTDVFGPIWFQKNRSLLYFSFFFVSVLAGASPKIKNLIVNNYQFLTETWLFRIVISAMLFGILRYFQASMVGKPNSYLDAFIYCALYVFIVVVVSSAWLATIGNFINKRSRFMMSLTKQSYGIFIFHFLIVIWVQYFVYNLNLMAIQKFYIVFSFSLFLSWLVTIILRQIPLIRRII